MITGKTKLLGVIGYPITHSLSPIMHNAAIQAINNQQNVIDYVYLPFPIKPEDLNIAIAGFSAIGVRGFNITIPHKQTILPLLSLAHNNLSKQKNCFFKRVCLNYWAILYVAL